MDELFLPPTDVLYSQQWNLQKMKIPQAWQLLHNHDTEKTYGSPDIVIGILDAGIKSTTINGELVCTHLDLGGIVLNGKKKIHSFYDFAADEPNNNDLNDSSGNPDYHGMYCAGIAAANTRARSSYGMTGISPGSRLMARKRDEGTADYIMAEQLLGMAGIVKTHGVYQFIPAKACDIINCSFNWLYNGESSHDTPIHTIEAAEALAEKGRNGLGTILVVAAGNNNEEISIKNLLPKYTDAIVVGASSVNAAGEETFTEYSNYKDDFAKVDICAPSSFVVGVPLETQPVVWNGLVTTTLQGQGNITPDHINNFGGTSAAAPMVAGVIALMLTANPNLTSSEVKKILQDTADIIDRNNTDTQAQWYTVPGILPNHRPVLYSNRLGYGRVNAERAVQKAIDMIVA